MKADLDHAIEFLQRWKPGGPWVLTAINEEKYPKQAPTRTFTDAAGARAWIGSMNTEWNVYFSPNSMMRPMSKKPARTDVASMDWLHVDIDPEKTRDIDAEQKRILAILSNPPESSKVPPPSVLLFSGGGYQAFWKLDRSYPIDGEKQNFETAKLYNITLEDVFGGDHCHNLDRVMRVPGTVNWPNEKKRNAGRKPALARLISWNDTTYSIEQFIPAPALQSAHSGFSGGSVSVSGNIRRLGSLDELPAAVTPLCKAVIVHGKDLDNPERWPSRSETLFYVVCELVRAGVDDDTIYSVITDPDFAISSSVIEQGTGTERYALRQIERAREFAIDPMLAELNAKHAIISDVGGHCRVLTETYDHSLERTVVSYQSAADIKLRYCNRYIETVGAAGRPSQVDLGTWWIRHTNRRQYDSVVFAPNRATPGAYNLWRGFAFQPKAGDCSKFLDHVKTIICANNEAHYQYVMGWLARAVQHPDRQGETALVLRGNMGTGKSAFAKIFGKLFGRHFLQVSDPKHLVGSFNAHLRDCVVLFGDEAFYAGDRQHESVLKTMVTEEMLTIEGKGENTVPGRNYTHIIMASNSQWVIPAGKDERRFVVLDVSEARIQDRKYFAALYKEADEGGYAALLHYLMHYDISSFDVRAMPKTQALLEQKIHSFTQEEEWWYSKLVSGELFEGRGEWPSEVIVPLLVDDFSHYTLKWRNGAQSNSTKVGRFLRRAIPEHVVRTQAGGEVSCTLATGEVRLFKRPYMYSNFPTLDECRAFWDAKFGGPYAWPKVRDPGPKAEVF